MFFVKSRVLFALESSVRFLWLGMINSSDYSLERIIVLIFFSLLILNSSRSLSLKIDTCDESKKSNFMKAVSFVSFSTFHSRFYVLSLYAFSIITLESIARSNYSRVLLVSPG
jgi:hypothetical protein